MCSILGRWQFSPNWSVVSMQLQSKFQKDNIMLYKRTQYGKAKGQIESRPSWRITKSWGIALQISKTHYNAIVIKTLLYQPKIPNKPNWTESCWTIGVFSKTWLRTRQVLHCSEKWTTIQYMMLRKVVIPYGKEKWTWVHSHHMYTQIISMWMKYLNVEAKI